MSLLDVDDILCGSIVPSNLDYGSCDVDDFSQVPGTEVPQKKEPLCGLNDVDLDLVKKCTNEETFS